MRFSHATKVGRTIFLSLLFSVTLAQEKSVDIALPQDTSAGLGVAIDLLLEEEIENGYDISIGELTVQNVGGGTFDVEVPLEVKRDPKFRDLLVETLNLYKVDSNSLANNVVRSFIIPGEGDLYGRKGAVEFAFHYEDIDPLLLRNFSALVQLLNEDGHVIAQTPVPMIREGGRFQGPLAVGIPKANWRDGKYADELVGYYHETASVPITFRGLTASQLERVDRVSVKVEPTHYRRGQPVTFDSSRLRAVFLDEKNAAELQVEPGVMLLADNATSSRTFLTFYAGEPNVVSVKSLERALVVIAVDGEVVTSLEDVADRVIGRKDPIELTIWKQDDNETATVACDAEYSLENYDARRGADTFSHIDMTEEGDFAGSIPLPSPLFGCLVQAFNPFNPDSSH